MPVENILNNINSSDNDAEKEAEIASFDVDVKNNSFYDDSNNVDDINNDDVNINVHNDVLKIDLQNKDVLNIVLHNKDVSNGDLNNDDDVNNDDDNNGDVNNGDDVNNDNLQNDANTEKCRQNGSVERTKISIQVDSISTKSVDEYVII